MYTILINSDNELVHTIKERIMCRSKLVDSLHFLTEPTYKETDMTPFTVTLEYRLPISKEYHIEILDRSEDMYKGMLEYKLPFDTTLTKEAGDIEMQLTFTNAEMLVDGSVTQYVRKTEKTTLTITPIEAWADMIPDKVLTSLDQRLLKQDAAMKELADIISAIDDQKADDISLENNHLQLTANGEKIGEGVDLNAVEASNANVKLVKF